MRIGYDNKYHNNNQLQSNRRRLRHHYLLGLLVVTNIILASSSSSSWLVMGSSVVDNVDNTSSTMRDQQQQQQPVVRQRLLRQTTTVSQTQQSLLESMIKNDKDFVTLGGMKEVSSVIHETTTSTTSSSENNNGNNVVTTAEEGKQFLIDLQHHAEDVYKHDKGGYPNLHAVIHVGPMKTGSTAIQFTLSHLFNKNLLQLDQYEYPNSQYANGVNNGRVHEAITFYECFDLSSYSHEPGGSRCDFPTLQRVQDIATERRMNLVMSAEGFHKLGIQIELLKIFLLSSGWGQITIVMFYRRYYDWNYSLYNQGAKFAQVQDRHPIVKFIEKLYNTRFDNPIEDGEYNPNYVIKEQKRYAEYFDDIRLYNMHTIPNKDVREAILCEAMPQNNNHSHYCDTFHEIQRKELEEPHVHTTNGHMPLAYDALAYYALQLQLWTESDTLNIQHVTELTRQHQEITLQRNEYEFHSNYFHCISNEIYDWLLKVSLEAEETLFPETYYSTGKNEILMDYEASRLKFCDLDAKLLLSKEYENSNTNTKEWRDFFQSL